MAFLGWETKASLNRKVTQELNWVGFVLQGMMTLSWCAFVGYRAMTFTGCL